MQFCLVTTQKYKSLASDLDRALPPGMVFAHFGKGEREAPNVIECPAGLSHASRLRNSCEEWPSVVCDSSAEVALVADAMEFAQSLLHFQTAR
jgi:hypothetical protein